MELILLLVCGVITIITALCVLFSRNTVHSALWMVAMFFFMAVLFLLLRMEFIAVLQIVVYAGAIMMFIIYAIMMLNLRQSGPESLGKTKIFGLGLTAVLLLVLIISAVDRGVSAMRGPMTDTLVETYGQFAVISNYLFSDFLVPFEVVSLLLTAGVVGSVALAKRKS